MLGRLCFQLQKALILVKVAIVWTLATFLYSWSLGWKSSIHNTRDSSGNAISTLILGQTLTAGFSPDWVALNGKGFSEDKVTGPIGSYNAIRTYLWIGMLNEKNKEEHLVKKMGPFATAIEQLRRAPRESMQKQVSILNPVAPAFPAAAVPRCHAVGLFPVFCEARFLIEINWWRAGTIIITTMCWVYLVLVGTTNASDLASMVSCNRHGAKQCR